MLETPNSAPTRICLVRHGETEWNAARRIQGQIDIGLNETGMHQAEAAGRWLKTAGIVGLYSSDLKRAWCTAQAIGQVLGLAPLAVPEMRERRYGVFEGLTYAEAAEKFPAGYAAFEGRNADYDFENGESLKCMYARVTNKLTELADRHPGQKIVVVVHGGVLDVINRFVRGNPLEMPRDFLIPNAGINWISATIETTAGPRTTETTAGSRGDGRWTVETWGETAHLADGALDELPS